MHEQGASSWFGRAAPRTTNPLQRVPLLLDEESLGLFPSSSSNPLLECASHPSLPFTLSHVALLVGLVPVELHTITSLPLVQRPPGMALNCWRRGRMQEPRPQRAVVVGVGERFETLREIALTGKNGRTRGVHHQRRRAR